MRPAEYQLAAELLDEVMTDLRAEYVDQIISATKLSDSIEVASHAMRVVVLEEVVGTIVARAHDTVPSQPLESVNE